MSMREHHHGQKARHSKVPSRQVTFRKTRSCQRIPHSEVRTRAEIITTISPPITLPIIACNCTKVTLVPRLFTDCRPMFKAVHSFTVYSAVRANKKLTMNAQLTMTYIHRARTCGRIATAVAPAAPKVKLPRVQLRTALALRTRGTTPWSETINCGGHCATGVRCHQCPFVHNWSNSLNLYL